VSTVSPAKALALARGFAAQDCDGFPATREFPHDPGADETGAARDEDHPASRLG
jgi:hypothetical protein